MYIGSDSSVRTDFFHNTDPYPNLQGIKYYLKSTVRFISIKNYDHRLGLGEKLLVCGMQLAL